MADYRPVSRDDDQRKRITRYAFSPDSGPYDPDEELDERRRRMWSFGEPRGLYESGELRACCSHVEFTARIRDTWLDLGGLTAVASPPEHRREGYVGELIGRSLAEYRDRGWPISALLPFDESFYARLGWATGCRYWHATVEPSALAPVRSVADGEFVRVPPDEHERLGPVYESWLDGATLATRRSDDWWRDRVFQGFDSELFCYAWRRAGEVRGYLIYGVEDGEDGRRLSVDELAYADHEALLNLLRFCADHDSQVASVELVGHALDSLVDVVEDRDALDLELRPGQMVRVVDVPEALSAVPYPGVDGVELVLSVEDDHAPWNDGTFAIRVRDGEAAVEPVERRPDASVGIGTLSQLFVGYQSAERVRVHGDLTARDPEAIADLARLFPPQETTLPERF